LILDDGVCGIAVPLVGVDYYDSTDLKGMDLDLSNGTITGSWNVERGIVDINLFSKAIDTLYSDIELRKKYGKEGREKVLRHYDWEIVNKSWKNYLTRMLQ